MCLVIDIPVLKQEMGREKEIQGVYRPAEIIK